MALEFRLPDIGEGLTEATIVEWRVAEGEPIGLDVPMVEIETDKAVVEIPAPRAGVILHRGAADGDTIAVGDILVVIGDEGESWQPGEAAPPAAAAAKPIVGTLEEAGPEPVSTGGVQALPLVRRRAAELGVDLASVGGTGPGGRITREDVEAAAAGSGDVERVRMSPVRRTIAANLTRSWQEIPHVTTFGVADPGPLFRERAEREQALGRKVPLEALLVARLVPVLEAHPEFNATLDGEYVLLRRHYDIGVAVDTPEGLMVAVVHGADGLTVEETADEVTRLAAAARDRSITAEDLRGATFTVSNVGAVGGGFGTPIIPWGTTAILSVGRAEEKPVVRSGAVYVRREMPLSLSYDHRVIDGALGRRFFADVVSALEGEAA